MIAPLAEAGDTAAFGGKAAALGAGVRAGLPVPRGYAVSVEALAAIVAGEPATLGRIAELAGELALPVAARSSAVGEDAAEASFAGQHATVLNLMSAEAIVGGLRQVHGSAHSEGALAYRKRKGIDAPVRIAAVVQELVDPVAAGVLFTRHPVTGAEEFVIEAAWGLGEAVVQGLVTPDHYRLDRAGRLIEERVGDKPVAIRRAAGGGTEEAEVEAALVERSCLADADLASLVRLATACEAAFGRDLDIEWAIAGDRVYLLQSRPITTRR
jgi:pyruvate,water dikinase